MLKKTRVFFLCAVMSFWLCDATNVSSEYSMDEVTNKVQLLQSFVEQQNTDGIKKTYTELQNLVDQLNNEAKSATSPSLNESGDDEICGDSYTEFVMLLNMRLAPLRIEDTCEAIKKALVDKND